MSWQFPDWIQIDFAMLHQLYQIAVIQKALKFANSFL